MDSPPDMAAGSRPMLGFHLGIALLLVSIFTLTGIFSCCYHWDRIRRSLSQRAAEDHAKLTDRKEETLPVIMPGDDVPKFIALTCPLEPPRPQGGVAGEVLRPPPRPRPKPLLAAVPFYTLVGPY
ncbi:uncharacterized protein At5g65660-like [Andrographis paniculata]|uniref:uncharacterized protein At5g65660-like n=1 Tax=Andrographis paniculata TaxID=175694 RepID=UPI0021E99D61|nr:uncharacterized protein At5g65660-like [Andrographis paniculata]